MVSQLRSVTNTPEKYICHLRKEIKSTMTSVVQWSHKRKKKKNTLRKHKCSDHPLFSNIRCQRSQRWPRQQSNWFLSIYIYLYIYIYITHVHNRYICTLSRTYLHAFSFQTSTGLRSPRRAGCSEEKSKSHSEKQEHLSSCTQGLQEINTGFLLP